MDDDDEDDDDEDDDDDEEDDEEVCCAPDIMPMLGSAASDGAGVGASLCSRAVTFAAPLLCWVAAEPLRVLAHIPDTAYSRHMRACASWLVCWSS